MRIAFAGALGRLPTAESGEPDEPVLGEPVSGQIPCYQGKKQGISQNC